LQVHENTIYDWLDQGGIFPNAFKIKRGWRIPREDVQRAKRRDFEPPQPTVAATVSRPASGFVKNWKS